MYNKSLYITWCVSHDRHQHVPTQRPQVNVPYDADELPDDPEAIGC
jgi:hypothetical protein